MKRKSGAKKKDSVLKVHNEEREKNENSSEEVSLKKQMSWILLCFLNCVDHHEGKKRKTIRKLWSLQRSLQREEAME